MGQETLATEADLEAAALHLDESGMPYNRLDFKAEAAERIRSRTAAAPDQSVAFMLDGEEIGSRPNTVEMTDRSLRLLSGEGLTADRMRRATDQNILLTTGPHPCQVAVASVAAAPPESP
jgi:preprotein translocase subunit SecD